MMTPDAIDRLRRLQEDTAFLNKILTDALLAAEKPAVPDPHDFAIACLRNSGTTCGACVEVAFTGATTAAHACEKTPATPSLPWEVRRKGGGRVIARAKDASSAEAFRFAQLRPNEWEVAPAAPTPAIVPVRFNDHGDAFGDSWAASTTHASVSIVLDLRPGEDAGECVARILAAGGRGP